MTSDVSTEPIDGLVKAFLQFLHDQAFDVFWKNINKSYKKKKQQQQQKNKKKKKPNVKADLLTAQDLHDHFKSLFGEQYTDQANSEPDLDQNAYHEELDSEFTPTELHSAVFAQKNNKRPGIDNISCEIIKTSFDFISPFELIQQDL